MPVPVMTRLRYKILTADIPAFMIGGRAGIHPTRLSEYSLNKKPIPPHHLILLCKYFRCEPEELIGWMTDEELAATG